MNCNINFETVDKNENESLNDYHNRAYTIFKKDLLDNIINFNELPVKVRKIPVEDNKVQGFFHVISEQDKKSKIRLYKNERVKYIPYISKLITDYSKCRSCDEECKIKIWTAPYLGKVNQQRTKIYLEREKYIVILEKRKTYYQLVTAYLVDRKDRHEDLLREYEKHCK